MAKIFSIFQGLVMLASPFLIFIPFLVNKIRHLDILVFISLSKKDERLGLFFNLSKLVFLIGSVLLFFIVSLDFYKELWLLNTEAFFLALISVGIIQISFVYTISCYLLSIYSRGFVYFDEILKIIVLAFITTLLHIIAAEFAFFPLKGMPTNNKSTDYPAVKNTILPGSLDNQSPSLLSNLATIIPNSFHNCKLKIENEPAAFPFLDDFPPATTRPVPADLHPPEFRRHAACSFFGTAVNKLGIYTSKLKPYDMVSTEPDSPMADSTSPSNFH